MKIAWLILIACASHPDAKPAPPGPHMVDDLYYVERGAPDPSACQTADDCMIDQIPDSTGCCIVSGFPYPQSKAWNAWLTTHLASCNVKCPGTMSPPVPQECLVQLQCVAGKCRNRCP